MLQGKIRVVNTARKQHRQRQNDFFKRKMRVSAVAFLQNLIQFLRQYIRRRRDLQTLLTETALNR